MLFYHAMWDIVNIFHVKASWFTPTFDHILQRFICITFISLSGFCFSLGSRRLRRGLTVSLASVIITLVTLIFMPSNVIVFGVLTLIGACMLITIPLEPFFSRINPFVGAAVSLALYISMRYLMYGFVGMEGFMIELPDFLYANYLTAFLGFPHSGFHSADYFPLFPWCFIFLFGYFLFRIFKNYNLLRFLKSPRIPPVEAVGKRTLIIYMLHQPITYGALYLIFSIIKR